MSKTFFAPARIGCKHSHLTRWFGRVALALSLSLAPSIASADASPSHKVEPDVQSRPPVDCEVLYPLFTDRGAWSGPKWPGGIVPYSFSNNVSTENRSVIRYSMDVLESVCDVVFVPRTTEFNYLVIQDSIKNSSSIGMLGGAQPLYINNWNYAYIMCHELMHALGAFHEHSRPDRDDYITVNLDHIQDGFKDQYDKQASASLLTPYDFNSVMHYSACGFSTCCPPGTACHECEADYTHCATMTVKPDYTYYQRRMGQRSHLSYYDELGLQIRYGSVPREAAESVQFHSWPHPNSLVTIPSPATLGIYDGDQPSFSFLMTTRTGYHALDGAPLDDTLPGFQLTAEYERFMNALFSTPGAISHVQIVDSSTTDDGGGIIRTTEWLPSSTLKKVTVIPVTPANRK